MHVHDQILTAVQMREAEAVLIAGGQTVEMLMERAGRGAADYVFRMAAGRAVTVLCGPGNNGGDGYVIARVLRERGVPVCVVAPVEPATAAARAARALYRGEIADDARGAVLVDCLFGTGLTRPLDQALLRLLSDLADAHPLRIAVDLPSGVASDNGALLNEDLPGYTLTIALGAWKWAHWLMPSAARIGQRRLVDLGIGETAGAGLLAPRARLRAPAADAHKYTRGLLAVVGGEMPGAAMLSARAAMHGGAGYVKLLAEARCAGPDDLVIDDAPLAEAMEDSRIAAKLVGPGLGRSEAAKARLQACLDRPGPLVLDADALILLEPAMMPRAGPLILTPHAGELAALCAAFDVEAADRLDRIRILAKLLGAIIVAKGPDTLIAAPDGVVQVMPPASSWLSTAGTGDVLAGLIAGRLAAGATPMQAANEGCQLHAEAARLAGPAFSATNLIDNISLAYENFL
jgi:hydroxyethylthiazole kinase-like uncharacterized protein yjeF